MAKKATLTDVAAGPSSATVLNDNFTALNDALENTLSRDGSTPNVMEADLDLDSNDILNANSVTTTSLTVGGVNLVDASAVPAWQGPWVTATAYAKDDLVSNDGNSYICLVAHTSGTFATDLTANYWELFAQKGSAGAGTGDMLAANNLSDVTNAATSRSNLGLGTLAEENTAPVAQGGTGATDAATARTNLGVAIGSDVQAFNAYLADLAGITYAAGDVLYFDGTDIVNLAKGTAGQVLTMNSGATAPEWGTSSGGWTELGRTTLTSDSSTCTVTGLAGYKNLRFIAVGETATAVTGIHVEGRASAGTWRRVLTAAGTASTSDIFMISGDIWNADGSDASGFKLASGTFSAENTPLDRSSNEHQIDTGSGEVLHGASFRSTEDWDELRIACGSGQFEGSDANTTTTLIVQGMD